MSFHIAIVSGFSGAGKTSVLKTLEDIGFFCIDNAPLPLLDSCADYARNQGSEQLGLGIDVRSGTELQEVITHIAQWRAAGYRVHLIFLTASSSVLIKRFQETRRRHPLSALGDLAHAVNCEKKILQALYDYADILLDTGHYTIHELRATIKKIFEAAPAVMTVTLLSFGFKYGIPAECNFVYDIRALPNPYFVDELKALTGVDERIQQYLFNNSVVQEYWDKLYSFITFSLEKSYQEGRCWMSIGIGCTGGKHRSVAFIERLAREQQEHIQYIVKHRDSARE